MNARLDILRERIRAADVPRARRGKSVVVATWNVRELGKHPRRKESLRFIAEVIRAFYLCAVIELREDLSDFRGVLGHLGPSFRAIFSEAIRDAGGNRERIAFVYDTRLVEFTGMASHLQPPRKKNGDEYLARVAWWRPPYVASFRSGRLEFVVAAAHIRWGSSVGPRAREIELLGARCALGWRLQYCERRERGVPGARGAANRGAGGARERIWDGPRAGQRYDQILAVPRNGVAFAGAGGALDFYAGSHRALYPMLNKTEFTFEMSDHLPLWAEVSSG